MSDPNTTFEDSEFEGFCTCEHQHPLSLPADYPYVYYCGVCLKKVAFEQRCWSCNAPIPDGASECPNCDAGLLPDDTY